MSTSTQSWLVPRVTVPVAVTMIVVGGLLVICAANTAMSYLGAPKLVLNPPVSATKFSVETGPPFVMAMLFAVGWFGVWMILAGIYGSRSSPVVAMTESATSSNE